MMNVSVSNDICSIPFVMPDGKKYITLLSKKELGIIGNPLVDQYTMDSVFQRTSFSWIRLQEIKNCLDSGMLHSALILALTIPDICAKVEYNIADDKGGKYYQKWFDENIDQYNIGNTGKDEKHFDCFNGYMCYKLRCYMVHGSQSNINEIPNAPDSALRKRGYDRVAFDFSDRPFSEFIDIIGDNQKIAVFHKSIPQLIMQIISCAEGCYESHEDKSPFFDGCRIFNSTEMIAYELHK